MYKQTKEITLNDGRDIKNFYWRVVEWGKNEETGEAFVVVHHWFIKDEKGTSKVHERTYRKVISGDPSLAKVENYLMTLDQYKGSV